MDKVVQQIKEIFGKDVSIVKNISVAGGCINQTSVLTLSNNVSLFLKTNSLAAKGMFKAEYHGLMALACEEGPKVPEPVAHFCDSENQYLLMEYLSRGKKIKNFEAIFGQQLAAMHRCNTGLKWGFDEDNYIGTTPQINSYSSSWIEFFAVNRLLFQINFAKKQNRLGKTLLDRLYKLLDKLPDLLIEPAGVKSIIHGDLWSGNVMTGPLGEPVIIDPAVYYGHREADLAMTSLFGQRDDAFFAAYNATWPLEPGYNERKQIYNLYHMLNHLNIFGIGYTGQVSSIVNRFV
jgi:fructosamine-3-kinase